MSLAERGTSLLQKLEAVYYEVRRLESLAARPTETSEKPSVEFQVCGAEDSNELDLWNAKCELLTKENKDLKVKNEKLQLNCRSRDTLIQHLNEKLKKITVLNDSLQKEKDSQFSECLLKWNDPLKIERLLRTIASETEMYKSAVAKIQELFACQENEVCKLRDDFASVTKNNNVLSANAASLNARISDLGDKLDSTVTENGAMRVESLRLKSQAASLQYRNQEHQRRISELEANNKQLQEEVDEKQQLIESLQHSLEQSDVTIHEAYKLLENLDCLKRRSNPEVKSERPAASASDAHVATPPEEAKATTDLTVEEAPPSFVPHSTPADPISLVDSPAAGSKEVDETNSLYEEPAAYPAVVTEKPTVPKRLHSEMSSSDFSAVCAPTDHTVHRPPSYETSGTATPLTLTKKSPVKAAVLNIRRSAESAPASPNTTARSGNECGACGQSHSENTMMKCQGCLRGFHSICKKRILEKRLSEDDADCSFVTGAGGPFLCDQCYQ